MRESQSLTNSGDRERERVSKRKAIIKWEKLCQWVPVVVDLMVIIFFKIKVPRRH